MAAILLAYTALTAASGPITAILAVGRAMRGLGLERRARHIAYSPAPYALRTITEIFGHRRLGHRGDHLGAVADDALALDLRCRP